MLFSNRDLFKITLPLILQQLLTVLVGTIDSLMIAGVSEEAVSGISLVGSLDIVLITLFNALTGLHQQDQLQQAAQSTQRNTDQDVFAAGTNLGVGEGEHHAKYQQQGIVEEVQHSIQHSSSPAF